MSLSATVSLSTCSNICSHKKGNQAVQPEPTPNASAALLQTAAKSKSQEEAAAETLTKGFGFTLTGSTMTPPGLEEQYTRTLATDPQTKDVKETFAHTCKAGLCLNLDWAVCSVFQTSTRARAVLSERLASMILAQASRS